MLSSCAKLEKLSEAEKFDFFNSENEDQRELRRYTNDSPNNPPLIQYIVDQSDLQNIKTFNHIKKVCDYTKLGIKSTTLNEWNSKAEIPASIRALCLYDTKKINTATIDKIINFVSKGGTLYLLTSSEDVRFSFLIGLKPGADFSIDVASAGYNFKIPMLPDYKERKFGKELIFYGLKRSNFKENIKVFANAANNDYYPLITENSIGNGKVIFYNSTNYNEKPDRGLLFAMILKGLEGIPYPIANVNTIHLDDFPSPVYDVKQEPIKTELNQSLYEYVYKTFWPDMIKLADEFDIKYVALTTFDYDSNIQPPFLFNQWDLQKVKINDKTEILSNWIAKDILKNGHELGFHGYNHVSLVKKDWNNNPEFMRLALAAAEKKWRINGFGKLPSTYVPPSNIIDKTGLQQLSTAMPYIKFMCSIYNGDFNEGGNREYDFEPLEPKLFDFPRTANGFYLKEDANYALNSVYLYTGIWVHFLHPDDVYQIPGENNMSQGNYALRNTEGLGWYKTKNSDRAMYPLFRDLVKGMTTKYPQLRFVNGSDGGFLVNDWRASKYRHKYGNGEYLVEELNNEESITENQYWFLYGSNENASRIEAQLKKEGAAFKKTAFLEGSLYSIFTKKSKLKMIDLNHKTEEEKIFLDEVQMKVIADFEKFKKQVIELTTEKIYVDTSEEDFKKELQDLRQKMNASAKIDKAVWNKYAEYMSWDNKGNVVWKMLEHQVTKYPTTENILYSIDLSRILDYPSELEREKWLRLQMQAKPNDKSILSDYIASYNSAENKENIKDALEKLLKIDDSQETRMMYLQYLLDYEPDNALLFLEDITPSIDFENMAMQITWLYADKNNFAKAFDWSKFSTEIDFVTKMNWLIEIKLNEKLISEYSEYISKNPEDYKAKVLMSSFYHETGKFKNSWIIANTLPNDLPEKEALRKTLNTDVVYEQRDLKLDLAENHSELFYPKVLEKILKSDRRQYSDFVNLASSLETNREDIAALKNVLSYNIHDKKLNIHSIGATFSKMYELNLGINDPTDNITHTLFGLEYKFKRAIVENKINYWTSGRIEFSDQDIMFFQYTLGANLSKDKNYKSLELKIAPAESGGAHSKNIYRFQMNYFQDIYFLKFLNANISAEGNYYNKSSTLDTRVTTDEAYEGFICAKLFYDNGMQRKFKIMPFAESFYSNGSFDSADRAELRTGYPFWMLDDRFYYGGGMAVKIGQEQDNFTMRLEASYFEDDFSDNFKRFNGQFNYLLFDYTELTATLELFIQSEYYSNAVQFGIKHSLKKRKKK